MESTLITPIRFGYDYGSIDLPAIRFEDVENVIRDIQVIGNTLSWEVSDGKGNIVTKTAVLPSGNGDGMATLSLQGFPRLGVGNIEPGTLIWTVEGNTNYYSELRDLINLIYSENQISPYIERFARVGLTNTIPSAKLAVGGTVGQVLTKTSLGQEWANVSVGGSSNYKGDWAAGVYSVGDIVHFNSRFYIANVARTATDATPPNADADWLDITVPVISGRNKVGLTDDQVRFFNEWTFTNHTVSTESVYYSFTAARFYPSIALGISNTDWTTLDNIDWIGSVRADGNEEPITDDITEVRARYVAGYLQFEFTFSEDAWDEIYDASTVNDLKAPYMSVLTGSSTPLTYNATATNSNNRYYFIPTDRKLIGITNYSVLSSDSQIELNFKTRTNIGWSTESDPGRYKFELQVFRNFLRVRNTTLANVNKTTNTVYTAYDALNGEIDGDRNNYIESATYQKDNVINHYTIWTIKYKFTETGWNAIYDANTANKLKAPYTKVFNNINTELSYTAGGINTGYYTFDATNRILMMVISSVHPSFSSISLGLLSGYLQIQNDDGSQKAFGGSSRTTLVEAQASDKIKVSGSGDGTNNQDVINLSDFSNIEANILRDLTFITKEQIISNNIATIIAGSDDPILFNSNTGLIFNNSRGYITGFRVGGSSSGGSDPFPSCQNYFIELSQEAIGILYDNVTGDLRQPYTKLIVNGINFSPRSPGRVSFRYRFSISERLLIFCIPHQTTNLLINRNEGGAITIQISNNDNSVNLFETSSEERIAPIKKEDLKSYLDILAFPTEDADDDKELDAYVEEETSVTEFDAVLKSVTSDFVGWGDFLWFAGDSETDALGTITPAYESDNFGSLAVISNTFVGWKQNESKPIAIIIDGVRYKIGGKFGESRLKADKTIYYDYFGIANTDLQTKLTAIGADGTITDLKVEYEDGSEARGNLQLAARALKVTNISKLEDKLFDPTKDPDYEHQTTVPVTIGSSGYMYVKGTFNNNNPDQGKPDPRKIIRFLSNTGMIVQKDFYDNNLSDLSKITLNGEDYDITDVAVATSYSNRFGFDVNSERVIGGIRYVAISWNVPRGTFTPGKKELGFKTTTGTEISVVNFPEVNDLGIKGLLVPAQSIDGLPDLTESLSELAENTHYAAGVGKTELEITLGATGSYYKTDILGSNEGSSPDEAYIKDFSHSSFAIKKALFDSQFRVGTSQRVHHQLVTVGNTTTRYVMRNVLINTSYNSDGFTAGVKEINGEDWVYCSYTGKTSAFSGGTIHVIFVSTADQHISFGDLKKKVLRLNKAVGVAGVVNKLAEDTDLNAVLKSGTYLLEGSYANVPDVKEIVTKTAFQVNSREDKDIVLDVVDINKLNFYQNSSVEGISTTDGSLTPEDTGALLAYIVYYHGDFGSTTEQQALRSHINFTVKETGFAGKVLTHILIKRATDTDFERVAVTRLNDYSSDDEYGQYQTDTVVQGPFESGKINFEFDDGSFLFTHATNTTGLIKTVIDLKGTLYVDNKDGSGITQRIVTENGSVFERTDDNALDDGSHNIGTAWVTKRTAIITSGDKDVTVDEIIRNGIFTTPSGTFINKGGMKFKLTDLFFGGPLFVGPDNIISGSGTGKYIATEDITSLNFPNFDPQKRAGRISVISGDHDKKHPLAAVFEWDTEATTKRFIMKAVWNWQQGGDLPSASDFPSAVNLLINNDVKLNMRKQSSVGTQSGQYNGRTLANSNGVLYIAEIANFPANMNDGFSIRQVNRLDQFVIEDYSIPRVHRFPSNPTASQQVFLLNNIVHRDFTNLTLGESTSGNDKGFARASTLQATGFGSLSTDISDLGAFVSFGSDTSGRNIVYWKQSSDKRPLKLKILINPTGDGINAEKEGTPNYELDLTETSRDGTWIRYETTGYNIAILKQAGITSVAFNISFLDNDHTSSGFAGWSIPDIDYKANKFYTYNSTDEEWQLVE